MSAHVILNLLNELGKRDKMRGLPSILSLFRNEFNKFNKTRARMSHPRSGSDRTIASERQSTALATLYIGGSVTCS